MSDRLLVTLPVRIVERLSGYRRNLKRWLGEGRNRIYSHELAGLMGATPAQVRRDLMTIGFAGSPARGYDVAGLLRQVGSLLDPPNEEGVVLVGVGYLGRAILNHFAKTHPELPIRAAFDVSPEKVGRIVDGCRCYGITELEQVAPTVAALVGIMAVPMEAAQEVADRLVRAGVRGILNFTPARLRVPPEVHVEDVDIAVSLEKAAFYARARGSRPEAQP